MKGLEIKQNRKKLNLTQAELAIELGVSLKTVSNYEKGEVIPETKRVLLHKIFKKLNYENKELEDSLNNKVEDSGDKYHPKINSLRKVKLINEKINARTKSIELATKNKDWEIVEHHKDMIELLKEQIEIITEALADDYDDDED